MINCNYNKTFDKIRQGNRIVSVPNLKYTCINCKYKKECGLNRFNNSPEKNNEIIIKNLLQVKDFLKESLKEARNIERDICDGFYKDTYTFQVLTLRDAPAKGVVYRNEEFGYTVEYTVKEYLEKYPEDIDKKKLVGTHKVQNPEDVCYGLNIRELESDLEYIDEELRRYNKDNVRRVKT